MGDAPNAVTGTTEARIARDEDWVRVILQEPGDIEADFQYVSLCGEIDAVLVDDNDDMVAEIEPGQDSGVVTATGLPAGVYFLQIQPADAADFNFYDLTVDVTPNPDGGTGGETTGDSSGASASATASDSGASASATASDSGATASASASDSSAGSGSSGSDTDLPPGELFEQDDGCGCRHRGDRPRAAWMLLGLLGLVRRRRSRRS
jgi:MYXO-CTERM domain-containing protein